MIEPMKAVLAGRAVLGPGLDLRAQARRRPLPRPPRGARRVRLVSRTGRAHERRVPRDRGGARARAVPRTSSPTARSWRSTSGITSFSRLQRRGRERGAASFLYVFDLPRHDGEDLRDAAAARAQGAPAPRASLRRAGALHPAPQPSTARSCSARPARRGSRDVIAKRADSPYRAAAARATGSSSSATPSRSS